MKMLVSGLAAFVAGVGGGFYARAAEAGGPGRRTPPCSASPGWRCSSPSACAPTSPRCSPASASRISPAFIRPCSSSPRPRGRSCRCSSSASARSCWPRTPRAPCTMQAMRLQRALHEDSGGGPCGARGHRVRRAATIRGCTTDDDAAARRPTPATRRQRLPRWPAHERHRSDRHAASATSTATPALEAQGVTVRFGGLVALNDVSVVGAPRHASSGSSVPTARARPRCSACCRGCSGRNAGEVFLGGRRVTERRAVEAGAPRVWRARSSSSSCSWASRCASTSCSGTGSETNGAGCGATSSPPARCTATPTDETSA